MLLVRREFFDPVHHLFWRICVLKAAPKERIRCKGRQKSDKGIAKAARELDIPGKTEEGRRKFVERALQVASIPAEAKTAAIEAGLADHRKALREIAQAGTLEKALAKIDEIKKRAKEPKRSLDLSEHQESVSAVEGAWKAASELRSALHAAPPPVRAWFAKHLLPAVEV
jgi:hypothetical protein